VTAPGIIAEDAKRHNVTNPRHPQGHLRDDDKAGRKREALVVIGWCRGRIIARLSAGREVRESFNSSGTVADTEYSVARDGVKYVDRTCWREGGDSDTQARELVIRKRGKRGEKGRLGDRTLSDACVET